MLLWQRSVFIWGAGGDICQHTNILSAQNTGFVNVTAGGIYSNQCSAVPGDAAYESGGGASRYVTHMVLGVGPAVHWIAAGAGSGLANMSLPPRGAYCKLTRPTGACCFISVGHFRCNVLRREGATTGCRDMPLQRVGGGRRRFWDGC